MGRFGFGFGFGLSLTSKMGQIKKVSYKEVVKWVEQVELESHPQSVFKVLTAS